MSKPQWVLDLEAKPELPYEEIPGTIYMLCYDPAVIVRSVSRNYAGHSPVVARGGFESATPIRHYVGWTQQANPHKRINRHHRAATPVTVTLSTGTMRDEDRLQQTGNCPTCGGAFADSLAV